MAITIPLGIGFQPRRGTHSTLEFSIRLRERIEACILAAYAGLIASAILTAFSGGAIMALLMALIGDHAHSSSTGAAMGKFAMMGDLGSSIGPALAFLLIPLIGISWVYSINALFFFLCTIFLLIPLQSHTAVPVQE